MTKCVVTITKKSNPTFKKEVEYNEASWLANIIGIERMAANAKIDVYRDYQKSMLEPITENCPIELVYKHLEFDLDHIVTARVTFEN